MYEVGEPSPPPFGTYSGTPSRAQSRAPSRVQSRALSRVQVEDRSAMQSPAQQRLARQTPALDLEVGNIGTPGRQAGMQDLDFTPNIWNAAHLQLQGEPYNRPREVVRTQYREQMARAEEQRRIMDATQEAAEELQMARMLQRMEVERERLARQQSAVNILLQEVGEEEVENLNLQQVQEDLARQQRRVERAEDDVAQQQARRDGTNQPERRQQQQNGSGEPPRDNRENRNTNQNQASRPETRQTRYGGEDAESDINDEGLFGPFKRIGKVLYRINDPRIRDDPEIIRRNLTHLQSLNTELVERGLGTSLQPHEQQADMRTAIAIGNAIGKLRSEVLNVLETDLVDRVKRIEDNEKLSAKVKMEKKDEVKVNSLYVAEPGASHEVYRKCIQHSNNVVKVIERTVTFQNDPFNFILLLCKESNKMAMDFNLSKTQQWNLIFAHIPPSPVHDFLKLTGDLVNLFKVVSTFATRVVTRQSLEKQINSWRLVNTSEADMSMSLVVLIDLLNKNREDYGSEEASYPDLFKQAVSIIRRQDNLPRPVVDALDKARMRVREGDSFGEITQILASACHRYIGMRPSKNGNGNGNGQVKAITVQPLAIEYDGQAAYVKAIAQAGGQNQKQPQDKQKNQHQNQKNQQKQQSPKKNQQQKQDGNKQTDGQAQGKKNWKGKGKGAPSFVQPWPANCGYLSKNGNTLKAEFEAHFRGFCFKCGHSSHVANTCKIYPEKTTVLTLCDRCRQGLHDVCKSRRRDLPPLVSQPAIMDGVNQATVKAIMDGFSSLYSPGQLNLVTSIDEASDSD